NILLTCVGRRVALLESFRRAMGNLGIKGRLYGADHSALAPGFHVADEGLLVPSVAGPDYVEAILDQCRRHEIGLVVPLIDWELESLSQARSRFEKIGARLVISSPEVVDICRDKQKTFEFLKARGFNTPEVIPHEKAIDGPFPLFMKPRFGSSARDVHYLPDLESLAFYSRGGSGGSCVIQEFVRGKEHTVDVYAGLDGVPRVAVPRRRLEVRGGEVSKARTVRHPEIIRQSLRLVEALGKCCGVVTLQCFLTPNNEIKFIEMNPRFGGGVPLAIRAGADFPLWLIEEHLGRRPDIQPDDWQDGLVMLRYDAAVFRRSDELPDESDAGLWS
ncbi:MAG: ATP-grasp domain-containing protein, partial [Planctomycetota bacterium]|nr:ATP-grasp domain-containing protein [Planctomycetota bacterium]